MSFGYANHLNRAETHHPQQPLMIDSTMEKMTGYRRWRVPGGCYFFTVNLARHKNNSLFRLTDGFRRGKNRAKNHYPSPRLYPSYALKKMLKLK